LRGAREKVGWVDVVRVARDKSRSQPKAKKDDEGNGGLHFGGAECFLSASRSDPQCVDGMEKILSKCSLVLLSIDDCQIVVVDAVFVYSTLHCALYRLYTPSPRPSLNILSPVTLGEKLLTMT